MSAPDYIPPANRLAKGRRNALLEQNLRHRIEGDAAEQDLGRVELMIPPLDLAVLKVRFPELACVSDYETYNRAWDKFIDSDESLPYRVREKKSRFN